MNTRRTRLGLLPALLVLLLLGGCGIPGNAKNRATQLLNQAEKVDSQIANDRAALMSLLQQNPEIQRFAEREEWERKQDALAKELERLDAEAISKIRVLLKEDSKKRTAELLALVNGSGRALADLRTQSPKLLSRAEDMLAVLGSLPKIKAGSAAYAKELETKVAQARETLSVQSEKHPAKATIMEERFAAIATAFDTLSKRNQEIQAEAAKHERGEDANLALVLDNSNAISETRKELLEDIPKFESWTSELDRSYTKILEDMRIEHYITLARSSWDNNSDFNTEKIHTFKPAPVSESTYMALAPYTGVYGTYSTGWISSGFKLRAPASVPNIDYTEAWPRSHDDSELWVEDADIKLFHKYRIVSDEGETITDWVEVDEEEFAPYVEALGMSIASKPYGYFEEEVITQPHPPGMALVGDTRTGEWRQDRNGNSFWHYYGQYAMFNMLLGNTYGGNRYYRSDYDNWRNTRHASPYYGRSSSGQPIFGTRGMASTSTRYQNSEYARSGYTNTPPRSVRQGSVRRGGGPGNRGK